MMDATSALRVGLAAYQHQALTVARPDPAARVAEADAASGTGQPGASFRFRLGKLQISVLEQAPESQTTTARDAMASLRALEDQADQAASAAFALRQALAGTSRQEDAASAAGPLALDSSSAPASHVRKLAVAAYRQADLAWLADPYRPGLLLGVF